MHTNTTGFVEYKSSPHPQNGAIGAAAVNSGTAEWKVRVRVNTGGFAADVFVGVAKAGRTVHTMCPSAYGENFYDNECSDYSGFWCTGFIDHALSGTWTRYRNLPHCNDGDVVTVRVDFGAGTLTYMLNSVLIKTLPMGVTGMALSLVASVKGLGQSVNVV